MSDTFENAADAVCEWMSVLLHEAHEAMQSPLQSMPAQPYLHPVDVETDEPGIVDKRDEMHVTRYKPPLPHMVYRSRPARGPCEAETAAQGEPTVIRTVDAKRAEMDAETHLAKALMKAQRSAASAEKREARQQEQRAARAAETPEVRAARLAEARRTREERRRAKEDRAGDAVELVPPATDGKKKQRARATAPYSEDAFADSDASVATVLRPPVTRRKPGKMTVYESPMPHHRHLRALQDCAPHTSLLPALLHGEACDGLEIVQGPPGTGKTRVLVERIATVAKETRILLVAPTNVGAAMVYTRCVAQGYGDACALALAPERVPPGTAVQSNDPTRRLVVSTVSARSGPILDGQVFGAVFLDEAAMTPESMAWGLLRPEVRLFVMAGDVKQLPALTSDSGRSLRHDRSLMERLVAVHDYDNTVYLSVQHRMAPELLAFPNREFYENTLVCGQHAPARGSVQVRVVEGAVEEAVGSSWINRAEASVAADVARVEGEGTVLITPYAAQCRLLLAQATGCQVHTVDSYQGNEADTVVLSLVRDGTRGLGFWGDRRRLVVALTRARRKLVVVASGVSHWPEDAALTRFIRAGSTETGPQ